MKSPDYRKQILKWLKRLGRLPTSRFVGLTGIRYEAGLKILNELEKEKLVIKEAETTSTYWTLK